MLKKIATLGLLSIVILSLVACKSGVQLVIFYTLKEAYDTGWLTQEDL